MSAWLLAFLTFEKYKGFKIEVMLFVLKIFFLLISLFMRSAGLNVVESWAIQVFDITAAWYKIAT